MKTYICAVCGKTKRRVFTDAQLKRKHLRMFGRALKEGQLFAMVCYACQHGKAKPMFDAIKTMKKKGGRI